MTGPLRELVEAQGELHLVDEAFDKRPSNRTWRCDDQGEMCDLVGFSEQRPIAAAERNKYKTHLEMTQAECKQL